MEKIVEIKEFSKDILLFVRNMLQQLTPEQSPQRKELTEEKFRQIVESVQTHLFVMFDENETPVGTLSVGLYRTPSGYKAWIEDVVVDETFRGRQYGKKIVEHALNFIREAGADTIALTSNAGRIAANKLYQQSGFELYETNLYKIRL